MSKRKFKNNGIKGKVGYCNDLFLPNVTTTKGHYVYIRKIDKTGMCTVSTITSLADSRHSIKVGKMAQVRNGNIYPIPQNDANFSRWSGVNKTTMRVHISHIKDIGKKSFKYRHHFMIGKNK